MYRRQVDYKGLKAPQTTEDSSATLTPHKDTRKTSWLAISSMICSIIGLSFAIAHFEFGRNGFFQLFDSNAFANVAILFFPAAFVLAIIACVVIALRRKYLKGYIYTVIPFCLLLMWILGSALVGLRKITHAYIEKNYTAIYNFRQLGRAISEYSEDNDGCLPVANQWCDLLMKFDPNLSRDNFKHPSIEGAVIVFNKSLSGKKLEDLPDDIVLLFVAYGGWNLSGGKELLDQIDKELKAREHTDEGIAQKPRMPDVLLLNGRIVYYWFNEGYRDHSQADFKPLRWEPLTHMGQ